MRFLLDTHLLIWAANQSPQLPGEVDALLQDPSNRIFFSIVSIWEAAIKYNLGRPDFPFHPGVLRTALLANDFTELPILVEHTLGVIGMPPIHRDPFDRLLIAQANVENITLLTVDAKVAQYPGPIRLV